ncbi:DUF1801 domain-containing protein [Vitreimonas flagellata]|uniref:DUF1801 domain-containing protein n=1 Tax=Vitreimonas flagellata TaxID=2560861 RepID=UPI001074B4CC|nr:DUF1801 domain-containing protein [Vitreimonas flagellata]
MSGAKKKVSPKKATTTRSAAANDWRAAALENVRELIKDAAPEAIETRKWDVPAWEHDGILCTGETYKDKVKLTFAKGAALKDPAKLFNSSLDGNVRRALDIFEGDKLNAKAFKALIKEAAALNASKKKPAVKRAKNA